MGELEVEKNIIPKMEHVYQPMWNISKNTIFGYEALVRFPHEFTGGNVEQRFEAARLEGTLYEWDTQSITKAIRHFPSPLWNKGILLFINVYPSTLFHPEFPVFIHELLRRYPQIRSKVVFEINETIQEEAHWQLPDMKEKLLFLKEMGFDIALDDVGKGSVGMKEIVEFAPQFIKLDRYFSQELSRNRDKQRMVSLLIQYATPQMSVILEGIEEEEDLLQAKLLGVPIGQGYLLGRPNKLKTPELLYGSKYQPASYFLDSNYLNAYL